MGRQPKTVNNGNKQNSGNVRKNNQIFTTSRPQVTQTFVPRQISGNNDKKNETANSGEANGNTFTIEQFLQRYPEVKRLSSRFGGGKNKQNRVVGNINDKNNIRNNENGKKKNGRNGNKRNGGRKGKNKGNNNSNRNNNKQNKSKQPNVKENEKRKQKSANRRPLQQQNNIQIPVSSP